MKIEMIKIRRHRWFPFVYKDVILKITPDKPFENGDESYEQPICNGWILDIQD